MSLACLECCDGNFSFQDYIAFPQILRNTPRPYIPMCILYCLTSSQKCVADGSKILYQAPKMGDTEIPSPLYVLLKTESWSNILVRFITTQARAISFQ